jgi:cytochrome c biogenesis protein CcmG/thiol:disulfide interchange protein DsbE
VPCKVEHPILMRLAEDKRVAIYGINWKDKGPDAASWLKQLGNPYTAIGHDEPGRVGIEWGVYGAPETFVVDREGRIRYKHVGAITPQVLNDDILPLIAKLEK